MTSGSLCTLRTCYSLYWNPHSLSCRSGHVPSRAELKLTMWEYLQQRLRTSQRMTSLLNAAILYIHIIPLQIMCKLEWLYLLRTVIRMDLLCKFPTRLWWRFQKEMGAFRANIGHILHMSFLCFGLKVTNEAANVLATWLSNQMTSWCHITTWHCDGHYFITRTT